MRTVICTAMLVAMGTLSWTSDALALGEWLKVGKPITEAEGPQAATDRGTLIVTDLTTLAGELSIECSVVLDEAVGPGPHGRIEQLLTPGEAKVGEQPPELALLCKAVKTCEPSTTDVELWIRKLPWATKIEVMGAEPLRLDDVSEEGNGQPAILFACLIMNTKVEDECKWTLTSMELKNLVLPEEHVGRLFDWKAPVSSEAGTCSQGGANAGVLQGEGSITLDSGMILSVN